ncbi:hypothetical protein K0M31_012971 [Melipona bicolor]|uniref:Uncharacterized protein n=1 Tax=Melipona bicolor TaxID=60889 RepID=A0AA40FJ66_9HYME|nr:hypothetical protein K0M31_012971 [Melipona bicolor]
MGFFKHYEYLVDVATTALTDCHDEHEQDGKKSLSVAIVDELQECKEPILTIDLELEFQGSYSTHHEGNYAHKSQLNSTLEKWQKSFVVRANSDFIVLN